MCSVFCVLFLKGGWNLYQTENKANNHKQKSVKQMLEHLDTIFRCYYDRKMNMLTVKHWKWCTWHLKASVKNSSKLNKFLHSEVNLLIQLIIEQDQDGQNNNSKINL